MSSLLQIRGVSEEARRTLKARAAARGKSLNSYLLDLVNREVTRPTVAEVLDRASQRAERADVSALEAVANARAERDDQLRGARPLIVVDSAASCRGRRRPKKLNSEGALTTATRGCRGW